MYENQFYRMPYSQPGMNPLPSPTQNGILWVQGESGAKSWMVQPNSTVLLMDSEKNCFYIKTADVSGMPSMRIFDYTERTVQTQVPTDDKTDYCTKADLFEITAKYDALLQTVEELKKARKTPAKKEATDE